MKKEKIIQFVGFVTDIVQEDFLTSWERYSKQFMILPGTTTILQQETTIKTRFKYISKHEYSGQDIKFAFMKGRTSDHFPGQKVRVVQAGGYTHTGSSAEQDEDNDSVRIMAFISHDEPGIDVHHLLTDGPSFTIYQAYYENCMYASIVEFITTEMDAPGLLQQLTGRPGIEVALYRECLHHA